MIVQISRNDWAFEHNEDYFTQNIYYRGLYNNRSNGSSGSNYEIYGYLHIQILKNIAFFSQLKFIKFNKTIYKEYIKDYSKIINILKNLGIKCLQTHHQYEPKPFEHFILRMGFKELVKIYYKEI